jgi:hypothetical protein
VDTQAGDQGQAVSMTAERWDSYYDKERKARDVIVDFMEQQLHIRFTEPYNVADALINELDRAGLVILHKDRME